jgi:rod shape-determining protein MreC
LNKFSSYLKKYGGRLIIAVIVVALISGLVMRDSVNGASALENAAQSISLPSKKAAIGVVGWLENIYGYMFRYDSLAEENRLLNEQVTELENQLRAAKQFEIENVYLREQLALRSQHSDFVLESARIVDRGTSNWNTTLTIGKGTESGIEIGNCVVDSSNNLVGQIIEVGTGWATIRSVIDTDMNVGALVGESGTAAMVVGDFALMREGMTKLTYLTSGAQVFENDIILTSGRGGVFPRGLVIGSVSAVFTEAGGQVESATIIPAANPDGLTQVFIIKSFDVVE